MAHGVVAAVAVLIEFKLATSMISGMLDVVALKSEENDDVELFSVLVDSAVLLELPLLPLLELSIKTRVSESVTNKKADDLNDEQTVGSLSTRIEQT